MEGNVDFQDFTNAGSLVGAYVLGIFTQSVTNDSKAVVLCRMDLLEFSIALEYLASQQTVVDRGRGDDSEQIRKIKKILRLLDVNSAGLFIEIPKLKNLIDQSLTFISSEVAPFAIGVNLRGLWGDGMGRSYEASKIKKMRCFLDLGLMKRLFCSMHQGFQWK
jgi:hypothetical protein